MKPTEPAIMPEIPKARSRRRRTGIPAARAASKSWLNALMASPVKVRRKKSRSVK